MTSPILLLKQLIHLAAKRPAVSEQLEENELDQWLESLDEFVRISMPYGIEVQLMLATAFSGWGMYAAELLNDHDVTGDQILRSLFETNMFKFMGLEHTIETAPILIDIESVRRLINLSAYEKDLCCRAALLRMQIEQQASFVYADASSLEMLEFMLVGKRRNC